jgi:hypothetical protein
MQPPRAFSASRLGGIDTVVLIEPLADPALSRQIAGGLALGASE